MNEPKNPYEDRPSPSMIIYDPERHQQAEWDKEVIIARKAWQEGSSAQKAYDQQEIERLSSLLALRTGELGVANEDIENLEAQIAKLKSHPSLEPLTDEEIKGLIDSAIAVSRPNLDGFVDYQKKGKAINTILSKFINLEKQNKMLGQYCGELEAELLAKSQVKPETEKTDGEYITDKWELAVLRSARQSAIRKDREDRGQ